MNLLRQIILVLAVVGFVCATAVSVSAYATGGTHFAITDGSGTVAGLINAADGTQSATYEYDPFGQTLRKSGPAADLNPLRFSSRYTDTETDIVYYGFRYYAPATGRWLNRDPIGEWGGLNLYGFANNDPVNSMDFLGLAVGDWRDPRTEWCRLQGQLDAVKENVEDLWDAVSNPGETINSIVEAAKNPGETAKGIVDRMADAYEDYKENKFGCGDPCEALKTEGKVRANVAMAALGSGTGLKALGQLRKLKGAAKGVGLETRGLRPLPGTRQIPEGIPDGWRIRPTKGDGGTWYYDPANKGNAVRVMQGDPVSPFPNSQSPYVRWQKNGQALDINGNVVPKNTPDAHIPLQDFKFNPDLFK